MRERSSNTSKSTLDPIVLVGQPTLALRFDLSEGVYLWKIAAKPGTSARFEYESGRLVCPNRRSAAERGIKSDGIAGHSNRVRLLYRDIAGLWEEGGWRAAMDCVQRCGGQMAGHATGA
jgi:hypothetical protein